MQNEDWNHPSPESAKVSRQSERSWCQWEPCSGLNASWFLRTQASSGTNNPGTSGPAHISLTIHQAAHLSITCSGESSVK
jgi:hypothetical protein